MPTRLDNLEIAEVSGVDSPANEEPGWVVMKAHDLASLERSSATLYAALANVDEFLSAAPDEVVKASSTLQTYLEELLIEEPKRESLVAKVRNYFKSNQPEETPVEKNDDTPETGAETHAPETTYDDDFDLSAYGFADDDDAGTGDFAKSADVDGLKEVLSAMMDRIENIEKALTGSTAAEGQEHNGVEKSAPTLRDGIMAAARGNRVNLH